MQIVQRVASPYALNNLRTKSRRKLLYKGETISTQRWPSHVRADRTCEGQSRTSHVRSTSSKVGQASILSLNVTAAELHILVLLCILGIMYGCTDGSSNIRSDDTLACVKSAIVDRKNSQPPFVMTLEQRIGILYQCGTASLDHARQRRHFSAILPSIAW